MTVSAALVDVREWTFQLGPNLMAAINASFLATMLYRAHLVPKILPILGFIGIPLLVGKMLAVSFDVMDELTVTAFLLALPIAAWELGLGLWLTFKGFRPSPVLDEA